jgi:streptogramin lyase
LGLVFALSSLVASYAQQPPAFAPAAAEERVERITQIPLPGSGYIYDVAVADGAVWVTSQAGLLRVDPVTSEMLNVLPHDYLFRVFPGYEDLWITTGSLGQVLRFDPQTSALVDIDIGAGPVTYLAVSEDAVWVSAVSDLVRIDPATNEVADRLRSEPTFGDVAFGAGGLWAIAGAGTHSRGHRSDRARCGYRFVRARTCGSRIRLVDRWSR